MIDMSEVTIKNWEFEPDQSETVALVKMKDDKLDPAADYIVMYLADAAVIKYSTNVLKALENICNANNEYDLNKSIEKGREILDKIELLVKCSWENETNGE